VADSVRRSDADDAEGPMKAIGRIGQDGRLQGSEKAVFRGSEPSAVAGAGGRGWPVDGLARLPEQALLDQKQLAAALGVTKRTVRRMVVRFELPPPIRLAGRSVWLAGRVLGHIEARAERAAQDADRQAGRIRQYSP